MRNLSLRLRSASPAYLDARRSAAKDCAQTAPCTDALPRRTAVHRAERSCSTRSLQSHKRATPVLPALRTTTQLASHSHHQYPRPALQVTHSSPRPRATVNLIPQPTGTTTHTPRPILHSHQSISQPARRTHSTTNMRSANPTTPLKPIRTGRFSPPDRIHPQTTGSQIATC